MGLIKTGLTLAGGYGLLKAASKAVNEYEDKKHKRSSQPEHQYQQHNYLGREPHMNYMHSPQPQWQSHHEPQYYHGSHTGYNYFLERQPCSAQENRKSYGGQTPPPYHRGYGQTQGVVQTGSAQEYDPGRKL
ncbi:hypothetical protein BDV39DRAFT_126468 [Aspergillus sergii]|uniref:Uncharacterized protein n=1 Tax=Aspergillus sergii TaxID=1034303 RepID=A0A5N6WV53_9EURO|nr:hypothetical protein BDV39DRAFT_126468 [Aspergillus sergii]